MQPCLLNWLYIPKLSGLLSLRLYWPHQVRRRGNTHLLPQDLDQGFGSHLHGLGMFLICILEVLKVYLKLQKTGGESYQAGLLRGKMVGKLVIARKI